MEEQMHRNTTYFVSRVPFDHIGLKNIFKGINEFKHDINRKETIMQLYQL